MTIRRFTSDEVYDIGNTGASKEVNWNNGIQQRAVLTASTAFTFVNPGKRGEIFTMELLVDATGGYVPTWASCDWGDAGEPAYAANENYLINFYYDGTSYLNQPNYMSNLIAIAPIKGGFVPEYRAILDAWTLAGRTLPTKACQIKQNNLVKGLISSGAWANGDWLRVWKYDGTDDNLVLTDWLNPGGALDGAVDGTLARTNNSGLFQTSVSGAFQHNYNPAVDGVNFTKDDGMIVFVPVALINFNSGVLDDVNSTAVIRRVGVVDDYMVNDFSFTAPLTPAVGDIVFYGRKSATTLFKKINNAAEVETSINSVAVPDVMYTTFKRNRTASPGYTYDALDGIGQGYAIEWMGSYSGVNLELMRRAIYNYLN